MILRILLDSLMAPQPHLWMSKWGLGQHLSVPLGRLFHGWEIWAEGDRKQELWLIYLYLMLGDLLLNLEGMISILGGCDGCEEPEPQKPPSESD